MSDNRGHGWFVGFISEPCNRYRTYGGAPLANISWHWQLSAYSCGTICLYPALEYTKYLEGKAKKTISNNTLPQFCTAYTVKPSIGVYRSLLWQVVAPSTQGSLILKQQGNDSTIPDIVIISPVIYVMCWINARNFEETPAICWIRGNELNYKYCQNLLKNWSIPYLSSFVDTCTRLN